MQKQRCPCGLYGLYYARQIQHACQSGQSGMKRRPGPKPTDTYGTLTLDEIEELRRSGETLRQIGQAAGVTGERIGQILAKRPAANAAAKEIRRQVRQARRAEQARERKVRPRTGRAESHWDAEIAARIRRAGGFPLPGPVLGHGRGAGSYLVNGRIYLARHVSAPQSHNPRERTKFYRFRASLHKARPDYYLLLCGDTCLVIPQADIESPGIIDIPATFRSPKRGIDWRRYIDAWPWRAPLAVNVDEDAVPVPTIHPVR